MASSQPEALLDVVEGMGTVAPETLLKASSSLARPILLFCQWTQEAEVVGRFNQFYAEHAPAFAASDGEEEQDHVCYSIFRKYEEFFSSELESFLEESKEVELSDFSAAVEDILSSRRDKRMDQENDEDLNELLIDFALASLSYESFQSLMRGYSARLKEAAEALDDMGLF